MAGIRIWRNGEWEFGMAELEAERIGWAFGKDRGGDLSDRDGDSEETTQLIRV